MTDKQNYFTYTDNTSDNNDKIMENLHKQIIIDGCDVNGCDYYGPIQNDCVVDNCLCSENPNCHYKNWQRKEQECEKLKVQCELEKEMCTSWCDESYKDKEENIKLKEEIDNLKQYKSSKQASYEAIQAKCNELELKNRKLEAENEVLTWQRDEAQAHQYCLAYNNTCLKGNEKCIYSTCIFKSMLKIKQILAEIKEIAEKEVHTRMLFADKESFCDFYDILQKISECEVENV